MNIIGSVCRAITLTSIVALLTVPLWTRESGAAASAAPSTDVSALNQRIDELERRLNALEAAQKAPLTVRAPFVVVDDKGQQLVRVDISPKHNAPRLTVGSMQGSAVVLGADPQAGGVFQWIDPANKVSVWATGSPATFDIWDEKNGRPLIRLEDSPTGKGPQLTFAGKEGPAAILGAGPEGGLLVMDEKGQQLMHVERSSTRGPRLTIGSKEGSAAILSAGSEGGIVQLVDAANKVRLAAAGLTTGTQLKMNLREGTAFMGEDAGLPVFQAINKEGFPAAELRSMKAQNGQLTLTDEAGEWLVVAGKTTTGTGVVKTGPVENGPAVVMGNIARPASEIQGKKR
jgi:hypothetical protein